jgi:uncharacterized membrane protein YjgN (DUF898 family)
MGGFGSESRASDPTAPVPAERSIPFEFHGSGGEYFRIWIVNLLLTIATLGIYSAWAKVRRLRYFYGNTRLDGAAFEYHGRPIAILKGRLIAFWVYAVLYGATQFEPWTAIAVVPLAAVGVPWIIMKARRFQLRMTSYRGLRFGFDGDYRGALTAYVGWALLSVLSLGLLWPRSLWERVRYLLGHARYGSERARFTTGSRAFYGFCFATMGMGILLYAGIGLMIVLSVAPLAGESESAPSFDGMLMIGGALGLVVLVVFGTSITAYYRKSLLNASFGGLELGPHRLESTLETGPLCAILLSNFVLILLTLGLYMPWATVRQTRYQLANLRVVARGDLDAFTAAASAGTDAIGEELGDFFDVDFGL